MIVDLGSIYHCAWVATPSWPKRSWMYFCASSLNRACDCATNRPAFTVSYTSERSSMARLRLISSLNPSLCSLRTFFLTPSRPISASVALTK